jgi:hypothetical protein
MVETLQSCFVCEGWHEGFNQQRAAEFLDAVRQQDYTAEDDPKLATITTWVSDHGQSLDWLYFGDPGSLISRAAARSPSVAATPAAPDPIFAAIDRHRSLYAEYFARQDLVFGNGGEPEEDTEHQRLAALEDKAWRELLTVQPTTPKGAAALLRYAAHLNEKYEWNLFPEKAAAHAANSLESMAVRS